MAGRRSTGAAPDGWGPPAPVGAEAAGRPGEAAGHAGGGPDEPRGQGPRPGDEVAGVRLEALVGRGGTGAVWSGTEVASGSRVAVKLLDRPTGPREATVLGALRHPHVLPLRRVVADPPALVTELAPGGSLAAQVASRGTLDPGEVVTVVAPLADALAALHARGVVHGDVTATNILFLDRGRPVLADLGVAGLAGDGAAWATPGYAAPEVLAGARPGPAADVHGLAAAAWLALTGTVPPPEPERLPLSLLAPGCPPALQEAVSAALHPDPALRPPPDDLATAARAACPGLAVRLVPRAALGVRPDEAVTYRVREAAAADGGPDVTTRGARLLDIARRVTGRVALRARVARVARVASQRAPSGRTGRAQPGRGARAAQGAAPGGLAAAALGLAVALLLGWQSGALSAGTRNEASAGTVDARTTAPAVPAVPAVPAAPDGLSPAGAQHLAGPADLRATVTSLVAAREAALRAGDPGALALVHHPDGTTMAADRDAVRSGPLDVDYDVLAVHPVPGNPTQARAELRTTSPAGSEVEQVHLELTAAGDGWRIVSVRP